MLLKLFLVFIIIILLAVVVMLTLALVGSKTETIAKVPQLLLSLIQKFKRKQ